MEKEIIERLWRIAYINSHEFPFNEGTTEKYLYVQEKHCEWEATRIFGRFYWITELNKR